MNPVPPKNKAAAPPIDPENEATGLPGIRQWSTVYWLVGGIFVVTVVLLTLWTRMYS